MNKFDRIVWRINGILILGVAVLICIGVLLSIGNPFFRKTKDREANDIVNVNTETKKKEYLNLGEFEKIEERDFFYSPLYADKEGARSYYSKSSSTIRNYLFFDVSKTSSHWLLESHSWRITQTNNIYIELNDKCKSSIIKGFAFEIVKADSNDDGVLNYEDQSSIYISDYSGKNLKVVIEDANDILGIEQSDNDSIVVFFIKDGKNIANIVDINSGKILKSTVLPIKDQQTNNR